MQNLDRAFANFYAGRSAAPRFKKKGRSVNSFRFPDPEQFAIDAERGRVKLPKVGWVRYFNSRRVEGTPRQIAVSERGGRIDRSPQSR